MRRAVKEAELGLGRAALHDRHRDGLTVHAARARPQHLSQNNNGGGGGGVSLEQVVSGAVRLGVQCTAMALCAV